MPLSQALIVTDFFNKQAITIKQQIDQEIEILLYVFEKENKDEVRTLVRT